nr:redoxin family protein [Thiolinea sp.]
RWGSFEWSLVGQFYIAADNCSGPVSVNDAFVMEAWGLAQNAETITMLADGGAALTEALGLSMDNGNFGGLRSQHYAMLIEDGVVTALQVEQPKQFEVTRRRACWRCCKETGAP